MENCIFCRIINKELPATVVYENDHVIVIRDINPQAKIHVLAITKKHIESVNNIRESEKEDIYQVHLAIQETAKILGVDKSGYRIISNCGKGAGQTVLHLHYHILAGDNINESLI